MIKVTFLMPAYNAYPFIKYAVESMKSQTLRDFHAIIVDDGSDDRTPEYLDSIRDSRFQVIHQSNTGYVGALMNGVRLVETPYFARLDADDIALPERLEKQVMFLDSHDDVAAVGSRTGYIFLEKSHFKLNFLFKSFSPSVFPRMANPPFWDPITDGHNLVHPSTTIRKTAFDSVTGYRNLAPAEDFDLWVRFRNAGFRLACMAQTLCLYRIGKTSATSQSFLKSVQIVHYTRYCHQCKEAGLQEPSIQEYCATHPLSNDLIAAAKTKLETRNAMGKFLSGHFLSGTCGLLSVLTRERNFILSKIRSRL